jgi:hypothetical protein
MAAIFPAQPTLGYPTIELFETTTTPVIRFRMADIFGNTFPVSVQWRFGRTISKADLPRCKKQPETSRKSTTPLLKIVHNAMNAE